MANTRPTTVREPGGETIGTIKPGTPEMAEYLAAGYQMTIDEAEAIIADWEKDHRSWPLEEVRKARAMLAAYQASPEPVSNRSAWRLTPHPPRAPREDRNARR